MVSIEYMENKRLKATLITGFVLVAISLFLTVWLPLLQSFRVIFGSVYVLFLPGFAWTWMFWKAGTISNLERSILSLILSMIIVPLFVFLLSKIGARITLINIVFEVLTIIVIAFVLRFFLDKKTILTRAKQGLANKNIFQ